MTWSRHWIAEWRLERSACWRRLAASRAPGGVPGDATAAEENRRHLSEPTLANQATGRRPRLTATQGLMLRGLALFVASFLLVTTVRALAARGDRKSTRLNSSH